MPQAPIPQHILDALGQMKSFDNYDDFKQTIQGVYNIKQAIDEGRMDGSALKMFSSLMIANDNPQQIEQMAALYTQALHENGMIQSDKIENANWTDFYDSTPEMEMTKWPETEAEDNDPELPRRRQETHDNVNAAFNKAAGGVLVVHAPYELPQGIQAGSFQAQSLNLGVSAAFLGKVDDADFIDIDTGVAPTDQKLIEDQMKGGVDSSLGFREEASKPVVIIVGKRQELSDFFNDRANKTTFGMRFQHRLGIERKSQNNFY